MLRNDIKHLSFLQDKDKHGVEEAPVLVYKAREDSVISGLQFWCGSSREHTCITSGVVITYRAGKHDHPTYLRTFWCKSLCKTFDGANAFCINNLETQLLDLGGKSVAFAKLRMRKESFSVCTSAGVDCGDLDRPFDDSVV